MRFLGMNTGVSVVEYAKDFSSLSWLVVTLYLIWRILLVPLLPTHTRKPPATKPTFKNQPGPYMMLAYKCPLNILDHGAQSGSWLSTG